MKKRFLNLAKVFLILGLALSTTVTAKETRPQIINQYQGAIPQEIIEQLIADNPDGGVITILGYGEFSEDNKIDLYEESSADSTLNSGSRIASITYGPINTKKTITNSNHLAKDEFKFSVARGETVTIKTTYSGELKGQISGNFADKAKIGADITIKGQYEKGTTYTGPGEISSYNSREFRMKFYEELGSYEQTRDVYKGTTTSFGKIRTDRFTGTYKKPTKWISYAKDTNQ